MSTEGTPAPPKPQIQGAKITWSYILSVLAVFVVPPVLGGIAWFLANAAGKEGDPRAGTAKTAAIVGTALGMIVGVAYILNQ